jgi:hypothetical protein
MRTFTQTREVTLPIYDAVLGHSVVEVANELGLEIVTPADRIVNLKTAVLIWNGAKYWMAVDPKSAIIK